MIAICGASGFVGQNLMEYLSNVEEISLRSENWESLLFEKDIIINLVGKAHDHNGVATKQDYYYANIELTKNIFYAFLRSDAKLLIQISSIAAVEEFESNDPLLEESNCNPSSWYGKSKREAEVWLLSQLLPENKKLIILRPPMIHGPGDKGNLGLLYKFISKGLPYPLAGFNNTRSFISISNFNFYIGEIVKKYKNLENGIYHLSDNEAISTNEIINLIKKVSERKGISITLPKFIVNIIAGIGEIFPFPINKKKLKKLTSNLLVSNNKINTKLEIHELPETAKEGIIKTINWFMQNK